MSEEIPALTPKRVTIHCSDTPNGHPVPVETIRQWHKLPPPAGRGWADIAYHEVIEPDGTVEPGRPIAEQGAGVAGANENNVHICLIGCDRFTFEQWESLRRRLDYYREFYKVPTHEIYTHAQFPSAICQRKSCPNVSINQLLAWYLEDDVTPIREHILDFETTASTT